MFLSVPLLRAQNAEESARLMCYTARQGAKFLAASPDSFQRPQTCRKRSKREIQLHILQGFPGIGVQRAKALLQHFGCIEAILIAQLQDLLPVPGMGVSTAESLRWAVNEPEI